MSSQEFRDTANSGQLPWDTTWMGKEKPWTDSAKEQYFSMLNAEAANEHELEMWRLNNEYNTPEKQMERMVAAGINPAAAYQQISSGNASSAPGTHKTDSVRWHDTQDKLARINTIISGIRDIMSTVGSGISAAQGVQDLALRHQNNWYDKMRANAFASEGDGFIPGLYTAEQLQSNRGSTKGFVQVSPGLYASANYVQLFPEFFQGFKGSFSGGNYDLGVLARQDQHALVERRNRIDELMQKIFKGFDNGASTEDMLKWFLQLIAYGFQQRVGGGF